MLVFWSGAGWVIAWMGAAIGGWNTRMNVFLSSDCEVASPRSLPLQLHVERIEAALVRCLAGHCSRS